MNTLLISRFSFQNLKFISFCFSVFLFTNSFAQKAVPELWGMRVHDEAHALKPETVYQLEKELKVYEDTTSNQIAILIVQSLDGDVLEEYSLRVAEKWKLGKKEKDNGALLVISIDDHKMRIEVGQGLEGVLTDAQSSRIIRNEIAPEFRRGDYDAGVKAGINGIIKAIAGEYSNEASDSNNTTWIIIAIAMSIFFIVALIVSFVKEFKSSENQAVIKIPLTKKSKKGTKYREMGSSVLGPSLSGFGNERSSSSSGF